MCLELSIAPALTQSEALSVTEDIRDSEFRGWMGCELGFPCLSTELTSVSVAVTAQSIQCG